ncbi:MAG: peptidoglycan DD-metalloendopeptidase family protein, partial [Alphaproteobacteria bacterium]|nr:peptidoglycan DD-metalloendopeptidase family protein [Alphaproteobacteria bacterium]
VVFGTQPASTGRVYNSKADYYRQNPAPQTAPVRVSQSFGGDAGAPLKTEAIDRSDLPPVKTYGAPTRQAAADRRSVIVAQGDTVYAIARRTGVSPQAIIAENRLRPPYALSVGETLRIPNPEAKIANDLTQPAPAPVRIVASNERAHIVRPGDTLYSISRSSGVSVAALASANNLRPPYTLDVGQRLRLPSGASAALAARAPAQSEDVGAIARNVSYNTVKPADPAHMFDWPVKGAVIGKFGSGASGRRNDGINIAAPVGTPVRAAADGEVVYRGSELEGYGNLLLIKHADGYVTAYAHNDVMLVNKGDVVHKGQVIAKVGQTGAASEPQLHFEIRHNLKSVDPLALLQ